jgi:Domain of unknown function DUF1828
MTVKHQICEANCNGIKVSDIPIGYAIVTPFNWFTGDRLRYFARRQGSLIRLEESGDTLFEIEGAGVDLSAASRSSILSDLCNEYGVIFDDDEGLFRTDYAQESDIGLLSIKFLAFMMRVQDLTFTRKEKVASTFREDLILAFKNRFEPDFKVEINDAPISDLGLYKVDIIVRSDNGKLAAIYPATSEERALQALLFAKELETNKIDNVVPFLIFERGGGSGRITEATLAKAHNSELNLANWDGGAHTVLDKVTRHLRQA